MRLIKFNMTVTVAAVKAVDHFVRRSKVNPSLHSYPNPQLKENFRGLMDSHYGFDIFKSETARSEFVDPDREPFD